MVFSFIISSSILSIGDYREWERNFVCFKKGLWLTFKEISEAEFAKQPVNFKFLFSKAISWKRIQVKYALRGSVLIFHRFKTLQSPEQKSSFCGRMTLIICSVIFSEQLAKHTDCIWAWLIILFQNLKIMFFVGFDFWYSLPITVFVLREDWVICLL